MDGTADKCCFFNLSTNPLQSAYVCSYEPNTKMVLCAAFSRWTRHHANEDDDRFRELETNGKRFWTVMHSIRWLLEGTEIRRAMDRELERLRGNGTFDQLIDSALI